MNLNSHPFVIRLSTTRAAVGGSSEGLQTLILKNGKMKSNQLILLLMTVLLLLDPSGLLAQWKASAFGGISIPNLTAGGSENNPLNTGYSSRLGADFGLSGSYRLSPLFSLEARLEYAAEGGKKSGVQALTTPDAVAQYYTSQGMTPPPYLYADYKSTAKLNYLIIPILADLGWDLRRHSPWRFYVDAGPYFGILLSAKQVTSGSSPLYADAGKTQEIPGGPQSFDATSDIKDQLHKANFGIAGDIGISYAFGLSHSLFVQAGGNYGLLNIQKGTENGRNHVGAAIANLGYAYRFGKTD